MTAALPPPHRGRHWTPREVIALVADKKPGFPPGTDYAYSNTDYVLLGEVIHAVTGHDWAHEVRLRILNPSTCPTPTSPGWNLRSARSSPATFDVDDDGTFDNVETGRPWPSLETTEGAAGALVSTGPDLVTFADALFHGHLLTPDTMRAMTADGPFHPRFTNYGLGLEITRPDYRTTTWGHGGYLPGFRPILWYVPSRDTAVVVLTNDVRAEPRDLAELVIRTLSEVPQDDTDHPPLAKPRWWMPASEARLLSRIAFQSGSPCPSRVDCRRRLPCTAPDRLAARYA